MPEHDGFDREEFLLNVPGDIEARIIESKLKLYGIPVMRKYRGSSAYVNLYTGNTVFGIDLYVPSRALDIAKNIIGIGNTPAGCEHDNGTGTNSEDGQDTEALNVDINRDGTIVKDETNGEAETNASHDKKRIRNWWIILLFIAPGILWLVIYLARRLAEYVANAFD